MKKALLYTMYTLNITFEVKLVEIFAMIHLCRHFQATFGIYHMEKEVFHVFNKHELNIRNGSPVVGYRTRITSEFQRMQMWIWMETFLTKKLKKLSSVTILRLFTLCDKTTWYFLRLFSHKHKHIFPDVKSTYYSKHFPIKSTKSIKCRMLHLCDHRQ